MNRRLRFLAPALVILLVAGLALYAWSRRHPEQEYSGTVETREIQVGSKVGGRVTAVSVVEGQMVKAGASLVVFESHELEADRSQAQAQVEQATADLHRLEQGYRPEEIAQTAATAAEQHALLEAARIGPRPQELRQAQADYAATQADAMNAEDSYRRMEALARTDTISRQQFDDAKARRDGAAERAESAKEHLALLTAGTRKEDLQADENRYRQAQAAANLMRRGYRKEDIEAARGRLNEALGHVAELDARLQEAALIAPSDGVIEVVSVRPGDLVQPGRIVMTMLERSQLWVKVYVPETELARVRVGQKATATVDSFPGKIFSGEVQQISSQAEFLPRNVQTREDREHEVFGVKVRLDSSEGVLKSGMSATVRLQ